MRTPVVCMAPWKPAGYRCASKLDLLPGWGTAALALGSVSFALNILRNDEQWTGGVAAAKATVWYVGLSLNLGLIAAGLYFFVSRAVAYWERWTEANGFIDRTWQIITQVRTEHEGLTAAPYLLVSLVLALSSEYASCRS